MMKNAFYFMLKLFSSLRFLCWLFGCVEKRLDEKAMIDFKIYDVTDWATNNYNAYNTQYLKKKGNQTMKFGRSIESNVGNSFL